jgi:Tol biopolymer transport system component
MGNLFSKLLIIGLFAFSFLAFRKTGPLQKAMQHLPSDTLLYPEEKHFSNIRQLTFGGDNAEAYFSFDGKWLIFQHKDDKEGVLCDQMYIGKIPETRDEKFQPHMISSGKGRTTCGFFTKDGKHVIYASTYLGGDSCPPVPDRQKMKRYIWPVYDSYDIFMADLDGKIVRRLTDSKGYDAEATLSPDGTKMVFTSMRDGDLDLYIMDMNSYKVKRITHELGYDGGAWFSPDGKKIVWRASRPKTAEEIEDYKNLLKQNLVAPIQMEVWVANADGSDARQITNYGQANWAPNFLPDGQHIIFCSNQEYKRGFPFNMYVTDINGQGLEKVSRDNGFDAFPMFSPNGRRIVFSSNRESANGRDINIFIADWVN